MDGKGVKGFGEGSGCGQMEGKEGKRGSWYQLPRFPSFPISTVKGESHNQSACRKFVNQILAIRLPL